MHNTVADNNTPLCHNVGPNEPSNPTTTSWRDRLASLRTWLVNLFSPISCCKRPRHHECTNAENTQSPSTSPSLTKQESQSKHLPTTTPIVVREKVHAYVDAWYDANHDGIDLGRIDLPLVGEIDVFPDEREKAIYRKVFMLALTNLLEVEVKVAGVPMRLTVVEDVKDEGGEYG